MKTEAGHHVVLGAGPIGLAVVDELVSQGESVRLVRRGGRPIEGSPFEVISADLSHKSEAEQACAGAQAVYFCVGAPYHEWPKLLPPLQEAASKALQPQMQSSSFGEHLHVRPDAGQAMTEDLPYKAETRKRARKGGDV